MKWEVRYPDPILLSRESDRDCKPRNTGRSEGNSRKLDAAAMPRGRAQIDIHLDRIMHLAIWEHDDKASGSARWNVPIRSLPQGNEFHRYGKQGGALRRPPRGHDLHLFHDVEQANIIALAVD
jgi:hypothetical protein